MSSIATRRQSSVGAETKAFGEGRNKPGKQVREAYVFCAASYLADEFRQSQLVTAAAQVSVRAACRSSAPQGTRVRGNSSARHLCAGGCQMRLPRRLWTRQESLSLIC